MNFLDKNIIVANTSERYFVWTPPKTASVTASKILPNLGFKVYKKNGNYITPNYEKKIHNHSSNIFNGHESYFLITTLRNPYDLMVSKYKNYGDLSNGVSKDGFTFFLKNWLYSQEHELKYLDCYNYSKRIPDYIIRVENMYEDYISIPFVTKTEYYKNGTLLKDCSVKNNSTNPTNFKFDSLYDKNSADMVYYNFANVFELGKYDKNSWK